MPLTGICPARLVTAADKDAVLRVPKRSSCQKIRHNLNGSRHGMCRINPESSWKADPLVNSNNVEESPTRGRFPFSVKCNKNSTVYKTACAMFNFLKCKYRHKNRFQGYIEKSEKWFSIAGCEFCFPLCAFNFSTVPICYFG